MTQLTFWSRVPVWAGTLVIETAKALARQGGWTFGRRTRHKAGAYWKVHPTVAETTVIPIQRAIQLLSRGRRSSGDSARF